ncbi:hypothetical protein SAMN04488029_1075 [Reichenbachiella faecimaris]|uniref:Uncharacterized protein n=1 Tax=Reichenbachiella faecimaris TaxID=692418 RepID=A0A1W2G897_REIFA|nr:hypothetical protein [Reichenbachiella faecimaris]SMD32724.1 hypothetical protein SAMN04488029_1075 [Reichenbachiella faecimaris]
MMENADSNSSKQVDRHQSQIPQDIKNQWQTKLMPWMVAMPTLLILLFVYLATMQLKKFDTILENKNSSVIDEITQDESLDLSEFKNSMDYVRWVTLVRMEERSLNRRYTQGGVLLAARVFTKYLGFFTGMILAIVGAVFIIGKLQEKTTEIEGEVGNGMKGKLSSSSPGIIFGVLGTILMVSTILQHNEITVSDQPLFLNSTNLYLNTAGQHAKKPEKEEFQIQEINDNEVESP